MNSVINYGGYTLDAVMQQNPAWRLKTPAGADIRVVGQWGFNMSFSGMRAEWEAACMNATYGPGGCHGCWIDRSDDKSWVVVLADAGGRRGVAVFCFSLV